MKTEYYQIRKIKSKPHNLIIWKKANPLLNIKSVLKKIWANKLKAPAL